MEYKTAKRKTSKPSFIERAQHKHIPKTFRYLESFLESNNKVFD
ncbi:MAG: hypothetical protein ACTSPZ_06580 [Promethearchaeota archaeon]